MALASKILDSHDCVLEFQVLGLGLEDQDLGFGLACCP